MANGRTHRTVGLVATSALAAYGVAKGYPAEGLSAAAGCLIAATLLNPDLDVDGGYIGNAGARAIGIDPVYDLYFTAYRLAYKHRSKWSHFPVWSTVWRFLYLFFPLVTVVFKDQGTSRAKLLWWASIAQVLALPFIVFLIWATQQEALTNLWLWFIIGATVNDTLHWIFDLF